MRILSLFLAGCLLLLVVGCDSGEGEEPDPQPVDDPQIELVRPLPDTSLFVYDPGFTLDLREYFVYTGDDTLAFRAESGNSLVVTTRGAQLEVVPDGLGLADAVVTASDGAGERLIDTLAVHILAHPLEGEYELVAFFDEEYREIEHPLRVDISSEGKHWLTGSGRLGITPYGLIDWSIGYSVGSPSGDGMRTYGGRLVNADSGRVGNDVFTVERRSDTLDVMWPRFEYVDIDIYRLVRTR